MKTEDVVLWMKERIVAEIMEISLADLNRVISISLEIEDLLSDVDGILGTGGE